MYLLLQQHQIQMGIRLKDDDTIPSGGGEDTEDIKMKAPALEITKKQINLKL